jgi:hypothetical protein
MAQTDAETLTSRSLDRLADAAEAVAGDVKSTARGRVRHAIRLADRAYRQARRRALSAGGRADAFPRERSLMLLGIAAGTAVLVGVALRGGKRIEAPATDTDPASA